MSPSSRFHGIIVPIVTPVQADGSLDVASAEKLVDHIVRNGCGLLVLGTTGEVASLSPDVGERYVDLAVRVTAGRAPVFAAAVANSPSVATELAGRYLARGADAIVGLLPNYFKLEAAEMAAYFEHFASSVPGPVFVYNMPQTTGMSIPVEVIERLSHHANIVGLKDSEDTQGRPELVAQRLGGREDFALFMGVAALATRALKLGFNGVVPSSGNLHPDLWRELYAAARAGDWSSVARLQARTDAFASVLQTGRSLGQSLAALKAALGTRDLCAPHMLPPLRELDPASVAIVRAEVADFA